MIRTHSSIFIFTLFCGASKGFMKAFKAFIKPFEAPQRIAKIKISPNFLSSSGIGTGRVKILNVVISKREICTGRNLSLLEIWYLLISSVIRQKGEFQNGCFRKTKHRYLMRIQCVSFFISGPVMSRLGFKKGDNNGKTSVLRISSLRTQPFLHKFWWIKIGKSWVVVFFDKVSLINF